jgi:uncharacterized protein YjbI with pentapeptide repeats
VRIFHRITRELLAETEDTRTFTEMQLIGADFTSISFTDGVAFFDDANISDADLTRADLYWAFLYRARCVGTNFTGASLQGAVLDLADLAGANLTNADLSYDNLGGSTSLLGTCLSSAILVGTKLTGAQYDDQTVFPPAFDPEAAGMIKVQNNENAK